MIEKPWKKSHFTIKFASVASFRAQNYSCIYLIFGAKMKTFKKKLYQNSNETIFGNFCTLCKGIFFSFRSCLLTIQIFPISTTITSTLLEQTNNGKGSSILEERRASTLMGNLIDFFSCILMQKVTNHHEFGSQCNSAKLCSEMMMIDWCHSKYHYKISDKRNTYSGHFFGAKIQLLEQ